MHWQQGGNALDFQQDVIGNHDIGPKAERKRLALLNDGNRDLASEGNTVEPQHISQAFAVDRLQKTRSQRPVHGITLTLSPALHAIPATSV